MDKGALSIICLYLADEVIFNNVDEKLGTGLWIKLESLYMTKSTINQIYLMRQLYSFHIK